MSLENNNLFRFADFTIDLSERTLWRDGSPVALAPKVMETLCAFVENPGRLLTKDELLSRLWADTFVEERNLTQNIFTLRKVLGDGENGRRLIETVPRRGYRFVADVQPIEAVERLSISHSRQTKISAEGTVPTEELTTAVTQMAEGVSDNGRQTMEKRSIKGSSTSRGSSFFPMGIGVIAVLLAGILLWGWQSGLFAARSGVVNDRSGLRFDRLTDSGKVFFPAISPNEQFFAYVVVDKGLFNIELQNIASGSRTRIVGPSETELGGPKFSADSNFVYYRSVGALGESGAIFRVPVLGGTPRMIVPSALSNVGVSHDGESLSFIRWNTSINGQELVICRSSDGGEERVVSVRTGNRSFAVWNYSPNWSPDDQSVLVRLLAAPSEAEPEAKDEGFGLINVKNGIFTQLRLPQWADPIQAQWMPDGKTLVFLTKEHPTDPYQVWKVDFPSGAGSRITNDAHDYRYLSVAPSGQFILTTQQRDFSNLWTIPVDEPNAARQLTFSSELEHGSLGISWTPDGRHLVYTLADSHTYTNIWRLDTETLETRQLTFDSRKVNREPRITPDGTIYFTSNRENGTHVWRMDMDGNNLEQVTHGLGEGFTNVSADGRWLTYAAPIALPTGLWRKSLTTESDDVKVLEDAAGSNAPSPDGEQVVVSYKAPGIGGSIAYRYGIKRLDESSELEDLGFNPKFGAVAWKPDGSGFFYMKDLGINLNNIWYYDLRTRQHTPVTDFSDRMLSVALSPDGRTLATARGQTVSNVIKLSGF